MKLYIHLIIPVIKQRTLGFGRALLVRVGTVAAAGSGPSPPLLLLSLTQSPVLANSAHRLPWGVAAAVWGLM